MSNRRSWRILVSSAIALLLVAALFTPESEAEVTPPAGRAPFAWGQDPLWDRLERDFDAARSEGCDALASRIASAGAELDASLDAIEAAHPPADDPVLARAERAVFELAPLAAACASEAPRFAERVTRLRQVVKDASARWDPDSRPARERLYRLLYGSRAALEEVLLQVPDGTVPALMRGADEPSEAPSTVVHGVTLHSGDLLLSRGGAPTSAVIARGNDFPGNFSHVALLHVSEDGTPTLIESHIESGVGTSSAERYLADPKLRIAVLRLRSDVPALRADPLLAHHAAQDALERARAGHIAYDFAMDYADPEKQFCSEVASSAYHGRGITLWRGLSSMSGEGLTRWLGAFGARHFVTHAPSDLEYDPQLRVVAEWRDPDTLFSDHLDNAVLDAMLEGAEAGDRVEYAYWQLPVARALKAYSVIANAFGGVGPIPEGMSATTGLRVDWLRARHTAIRAGLERRVEAYQREHGRRPPYWTLVRLAREAKREAS